MADVSLVRGPITMKGPAQFVAIAESAFDLVTVDLAKLLTAPTTLRFVEKIGAPAPAFAKGYWRGSQRIADVKTLRRPDGSPKVGLVRYLVIHELLGHGADQDVMPGKRGRALAMMRPAATAWADADGRTGMARYWHLPSEAFANRMVEALTKGRVRSPYDDDYTRTIPNDRLDDLVDLVISTSTPPPAIPEPPLEPPTPEPPPVELDAVRQAWAEADGIIRAELDDFGRLLNP